MNAIFNLLSTGCQLWDWGSRIQELLEGWFKPFQFLDPLATSKGGLPSGCQAQPLSYQNEATVTENAPSPFLVCFFFYNSGRKGTRECREPSNYPTSSFCKDLEASWWSQWLTPHPQHGRNLTFYCMLICLFSVSLGPSGGGKSFSQ